MVDSVCRGDINSHYLVQNNCIEPNVSCANFKEYQNKYIKALVTLRSVQLIIITDIVSKSLLKT